MIKNTLIAIVTATALLGAAAPAMAGAFGDGDLDAHETIADTILANLQEQGVQATAVEEWGNLVRAYVIEADGTQTMQFFSPVTLQPVGI